MAGALSAGQDCRGGKAEPWRFFAAGSDVEGLDHGNARGEEAFPEVPVRRLGYYLKDKNSSYAQIIEDRTPGGDVIAHYV